MCRASPDQLAPFALTILHVDVTARIFQAAILELAVHVNALIQDDMLILKRLVFKPVHRLSRTNLVDALGRTRSVGPTLSDLAMEFGTSSRDLAADGNNIFSLPSLAKSF